jgi:3-hydroxyacyl-CoA dehydrogenase
MEPNIEPDIKKIGVVGAGTMGSSIAVCLVAQGLNVSLLEINQAALDAGLHKIESLMTGLVKKGLPEGEALIYKQRIKPILEFKSMVDSDLVIEAVQEDLSVKELVFGELDRHCKKDCIFASNTSSLPITQLASYTKRPELVVGMHFFNPAHLMKLIEVVPGLRTTSTTVEKALHFGSHLNKLAIKVEECPSFLVNRLLGRYTNEALYCLQDGSAQVEEIDQAACDLLMPVGPLALRDMNGMDVGLSVAEFNFREYGERFRPAKLLKELVDKKMLGKKTGRGFYLYEGEPAKKSGLNPEVQSIAKQLSKECAQTSIPFQPLRLFLPMINEAFLALQERICAPEDLDAALKAGLNMRKGPIEFAFEIGLPHCLEQTELLFNLLGERFRPAPLMKRYIWAGKSSLN